jgi:hypothetical protein
LAFEVQHKNPEQANPPPAAILQAHYVERGTLQPSTTDYKRVHKTITVPMAFDNALPFSVCRPEKLLIKLVSLLGLFGQWPRDFVLASGDVRRYLGSLLDGLAFWVEPHCWHQVTISQWAKWKGEIEDVERTISTSEKGIELETSSTLLTLEVGKTRLESATRLSLTFRIDSLAAVSRIDKLGLSSASFLASDSGKFLGEEYQVKELTSEDTSMSDNIRDFLTEEQEYGYLEEPIPDLETESVDSDWWEWNPDQEVFQHWDEDLGQMIICPDALD